MIIRQVEDKQIPMTPNTHQQIDSNIINVKANSNCWVILKEMIISTPTHINVVVY
jgi:hypothetical protein